MRDHAIVTTPGPVTGAESLVLSIFPGIDLLGRGFEEEGFCVVRGPDILWGGDVRTFAPPRGRFDGVIGGSPCVDYSSARRDPPSGVSDEMLSHYARVVTLAWPEWWLLENVPRCPDLTIPGYKTQRIDLRGWEVGLRQRRLRHFQFGARDGTWLLLPRTVTRPADPEPACVASEGNNPRRGWREFCAAQGIEPLELKPFTRSARYRVVGNAVPLPMARVVARAINTRSVTKGQPCVCGCGRPVDGRRVTAGAACRKRLQRRRDRAGVTDRRPDTFAPALEVCR